MSTPVQLTIDPEFKKLLDPLTPEEYAGLEASLLADGCLHPLILWGDTLIDGHNRYEICTKHNVSFKTAQKDFESSLHAEVWILKNQAGRRNLTSAQKDMKAIELQKRLAEIGKQNTSLGGGDKKSEEYKSGSPMSENPIEPIDSWEEAAQTFNTSKDSMSKTKYVMEHGDDKLKESLQKGDISRNAAYKTVRGVEKRKKKVEKIQAISENNVPLVTDKNYPVIYADPPWNHYHNVDSRDVEHHYPIMELADICALPVNTISADEAALFMWAVNPELEGALQVIEAWGFKYKTCMVWIKDKIGLGWYVRQQHELLLIATKGNFLTPKEADRPPSVIQAPRLAHSAKPKVVYEIIEKMYPEFDKIELFSRTPRKGWAMWGNEAHNA